MGCDIHALIERKNESRRDDGSVYWTEWVNSGDPDIGRNYEMFAVLAGVRNHNGVTPLAEPRGFPGFESWQAHGDGERWIRWADHDAKPCWAMVEMAERYGVDGHSASWFTLAEIKAYDTEQVILDESLVVGRDKAGKVTATAGWTSGPSEGPVGARKVLRWPGEEEPKCWLRLIRYMEQAKWDGQSDEEVRLVFFFDN